MKKPSKGSGKSAGKNANKGAKGGKGPGRGERPMSEAPGPRRLNKPAPSQQIERAPVPRERNEGRPEDLSTQLSRLPGDFQRIYGKHPVREALSGDRAVYKLWIAQGLNEHVIKEFEQLARERDVPVQLVPTQKLNQLLAHVDFSNHQGLVAEIGAYDYADWDKWITGLKAKQGDPFVLVLDQIQDPHNLGAILRTAEAAGVDGVIIPKHGGVGLSETVAKSSAGAIEVVPVLQVTNLNRALEELQQVGLWIMGLSANEGQNYYSANLTGPLALVIGSEQKGMRPNVEKHCDHKLIIPMHSTRSLNASVAAAVAMFEVVRQREVGPGGAGRR